MKIKEKTKSILFWSIISAAFIGPGTVTTAAMAGAGFGTSLLWALTFATFATIVLQESAARITLASGMSFGEILSLKFKKKGSNIYSWFAVIAILTGGVAYQAGNLLGAVAGLGIHINLNPKILISLIAVAASGLLFIGKSKHIANILGILVAFMGILFFITALSADFSLTDIIFSSLIPIIPEGSDLLVIGLIGTTIVPYNLFLASGLSEFQSKKEMRTGITGAVIIGGIISMAILITGSMVKGNFSFENLALVLQYRFGGYGSVLFGIGLFAAGFTSSVTAPYASAITVQSIFGKGKQEWAGNSIKFRLVWGLTLLIGLIIGISGLKPIPVIIMAQVLNGILLPFMVYLIYRLLNDKEILGNENVNGKIQNIVLLAIGGVTLFLGLNNIVQAIF